MPQGNGPGFLRGLIGRVGDNFVSGQNYNRQTGEWNATPGQYVTGLGSKALGLFNPALGKLASTAANGYYGQGPMAKMFNHGPGAPQMQHFGGDTSLSVPNIGMSPGMSMGAPQMGGSTPQQWSGSLAGANPFGGQYGGNLGIPTMPAVNVRPNGGALAFGGGRNGYNNGFGAGTGFGAYSVPNDAWGEAARSFGVGGMSGGARDQAMPMGPKFFVA